jgi:hypothetical protein
MAMFLFQAQAKLIGYHGFDRFLYAQAAILLGGKLSEQFEYTVEIVRHFRSAVRRWRQREGADSEDKLQSEARRVHEAEIVLMINTGFDMNLYCGVTYLANWQKMVGDNRFFSNALQQTTKLYSTSTCLYFEP